MQSEEIKNVLYFCKKKDNWRINARWYEHIFFDTDFTYVQQVKILFLKTMRP